VRGSLFYRAVRAAFRILALPLFRFRVEGSEKVPSAGPGVVVALHRSWLDPACLGGACPRPLSFLMQRDVYHKRWGRWFYRRMGAIPVPVGGGPATAALRAAVRHLEAGELLGIFPEGGIGGKGTEPTFFRGAAHLAVRCKAPLIPVEIEGSARAWPHGRKWPGPARIVVRFGNAMSPKGELTGKEAADELLRRAMWVLDEDGEKNP
jgi:1-acyl-sn-glycerol-3-phosphate acyltransferase